MSRRLMLAGALLAVTFTGCLRTRQIEQTSFVSSSLSTDGHAATTAHGTYDERQWHGPGLMGSGRTHR